MIFAGQENPFVIFRSKKINIYFKTNNKKTHKFAEIMKKTGFLVSFILEDTLTVNDFWELNNLIYTHDTAIRYSQIHPEV